MDVKEIKAAIAQLQSAKKIAILSHVSPDGDAYGSMLGLGLSLQAMGKEVLLFNENGAPRTFPTLLSIANEKLPIEKTPETRPDCDLIVTVDTATFDRLGPTFAKWGAKPDIKIDHHEGNDNYASINLVNPSAPSATTIVHDLIKRNNFPMDQDIATSLYKGLATDTNYFNVNKIPWTFRTKESLVAAGANTQRDPIPPEWVALRKAAMEMIQFAGPNNSIAVLPISAEFLAEHGHIPAGDAKAAIGSALTHIPGVSVGAVLLDSEATPKQDVRASLRSVGGPEEGVDVNAVAGTFGGGGHRNAAGAHLHANLQEATGQVIKAIEDTMSKMNSIPTFQKTERKKTSSLSTENTDSQRTKKRTHGRQRTRNSHTPLLPSIENINFESVSPSGIKSQDRNQSTALAY